MVQVISCTIFDVHFTHTPADKQAIIMEDLVMVKVLIADDYVQIRSILNTLVNKSGYEVVAVADGVQGFEQIMAQDFDLAIVDESMGGGDKDGSQMMIRAKEAGRPLKRVIAISDRWLQMLGNEKLEEELRTKWGASWLVLMPKPFNLNEMSLMIEQLLALPA